MLGLNIESEIYHFVSFSDFTSQAEFWLDEYEDDTFEKQIEDILEQLTPLYKQLHAYVRYQLNKKYGDKVNLKKPIPMHLLGNMWGELK